MNSIFKIFFYCFALLNYASISWGQYNSSNPQWQRLGPGGGGATFLPTFSYHSANTFFLRCDMTGSYLTKDGCKNYTQFNFDNGAASFAFDPADSKKIYVGSTVLNRSVDAGKTWQQIFPKKNEIAKEYYHGDHAEYKIEVSNKSSYDTVSATIKNIKIASDKHIYFSMGKRFYYSFDDGETFNYKEFPYSIESIHINKLLKDQVYVFTASAIFIFNTESQVLKEKVRQKNLPQLSSYAAGITKQHKIIFYALHNIDTAFINNSYNRTDVYISTDTGNNWKRIYDPLITNNGLAKPNFRKIVCAEFDADNAYLVSDLYEDQSTKGKSKFYYGALKTTNTGKNWQWVFKVGGGSGQYGVKDGIDASNLEDAWASKAFGKEFIEIEDIGIDPNNGNNVILTDWYRTIKTTNGGKTWKEIYSNKNDEQHFTSRGLDVTTCYGVHFDPFDSNHIAVSYTDIGFWHSYNKGKTWQPSVTGVPGLWVNTCYWAVFDPAVKNKIWSAWSGMHDIPRGKMTRNPDWKKNYSGGVCVSFDGGKTWQPSNNGLGDDALVTSIVLDEKSKPGNRILYASVYNKGVFKSTDDGKTWQQKNVCITGNTAAFEITLASNGDLYVVISLTPDHEKNNEQLYYTGAVYKSTDAAETWEKLSVANEPFFPNGIAVDPHNPQNVYLACWSNIYLSDLLGGKTTIKNGGNKKLPLQGGIFFSNNGGITWTSIFDQQQYVYDVFIDPLHNGRLYCNTFNKAAYRSDDFGKTWHLIKGYDFHWGHRIITDRNDPEKVFITTYGSGLWHGSPIIE